VQLLPGLSAIDAAVVVAIENIREERARTFFDELAKGDLEIAEEMKTDEDFLHAYFSTAKAALNTRRREKIRLFARLFRNYAQKVSIEFTDQYEEWLDILDDLSYREFQVLLILHSFEITVPRPENPKNELEWYQSFWDDFLKRVESEVGISSTELPGILERLTRTGLYGNVPVSQGLVFGAHILDSVGHLTSNFASFLQALDYFSGDDPTS
jgi:hypothetical protein